MKTRETVVALALLLSAGGALAQKQAPPAPAAPKDFQLPAPVEFKLENGLEVSLVPYGTVPKVRVELAILAGNAYEGVKQTWLADLTGDLMREGTTTKTASQISEAAAREEFRREIGARGLPVVAVEADDGQAALRIDRARHLFTVRRFAAWAMLG